MEVGSILFGLKDTDTPRIKRYMTALLRLLTKEKLTLYENIWFSNYEHGYWNYLLGHDQDSLTLKNAFKSAVKNLPALHRNRHNPFLIALSS